MTMSTTASVSRSLRAGLCIDIPTPQANSEPSDVSFCRSSPSPQTYQSGFTAVSSQASNVEEQSESAGTNSDKSYHILHRPLAFDSHVSMRSTGGMQGLLLAESGGGLVELDPLGGGSGFKQGTLVMPGLVTPRGGASGIDGPLIVPRPGPQVKTHTGEPRLHRQGTLLSQGVTPARNAAELKSLLGNSRSKIKSGAKVLPPPNMPGRRNSTDNIGASVALEQGKSRALVEVDILLESEMCVEGAYLTGKLHVKIRKRGAKEAPLLLSSGKVRVVGFEGIPNENYRHTFYQHAAPLSTISALSHVLYASSPDEDGFMKARDGRHIVPFVMKLPINDGIHVGAKGPFDNRSGVVVKYIALVSFKLKDSATSKRSIAHFYRSCEVYPSLDPSVVLAPAAHPLLSTTARNIFLGGTGKLKLTASLHRNTWVAGQRCCVGIAVHNETKKSVKGLTLSLIRTTTVFRPHPHLDVASPSSADPDACQTTTTSKLVAQTTLEAGQRGLRGHATAKGWWAGVESGARDNFRHFVLLPPDALSIVRSRLLEVQYAIRVSLVAGSLSSEVSVMLPLRIINHLSIDPPPSFPTSFPQPGIRPPVPPLPVPSGSSPTNSTPPAFTSFSMCDLRNGARPVMKDHFSSMFKVDANVRDLGRPSGAATISGVAYGGPSPPRIPFMPRLEEGCIESDGLRHDIAMRFRDDHSSNVLEEIRDMHEAHGDDNNEVSDDSWREETTEAPQIGNSNGLLNDLDVPDSDREVDFVVGSARIEEYEHSVTRLGYFKDDDELTVPAKGIQSLSSWKSHSEPSAEGNLSDGRVLPPQYAQREGPTLVPHFDPKLRIKTPDLIPRPSSPGPQIKVSWLPGSSTPDERSARTRTRADTLESTRASGISFRSQLPRKPPSERSQFSQRVERLVAARPAVRLDNPGTALESVGDTALGEETRTASPISEVSPPSSVLSGAEFALPQSKTSRRPPNCPSSFSKGPTPTRPAMSSSASGSVRSRIAQLEVRAGAAPGVALAVSQRPHSHFDAIGKVPKVIEKLVGEDGEDLRYNAPLLGHAASE